MARSAHAGGAAAFRPGESVLALALAGLIESPARAAQHGRARKLPRPCRGGEFVPVAAAGAAASENRSRPERSAARHLRLQRALLQAEASPWVCTWLIAAAV